MKNRQSTRDMRYTTYILDQHKDVLNFLKTRFPVYHLSNVFFRDIQYGIRTYLERKGKKIRYSDAEELAHAYTHKLESEGILRAVDHQTWVVDYPEYRTPVVKQAPAAKAATSTPPAARPPAPRPAPAPAHAAPASPQPKPAVPAPGESIADAPTLIAFPGSPDSIPQPPPKGDGGDAAKKEGGEET
jgi:hypothetical protein